MLYSIIGILVIILDQLVKYWVDSNINITNMPVDLIPNVLSLVRVQNDGAAFSFLSGGSARIWFIALTAVFAILVVLALATNFVSGRFGRWCLVFITAGGLSNMIDRVRFGYVIDMFKFELFDFAVFNVADIFITVFCIAFIIYILFGGEKEKEPEEDEFDEDDYEEEVRPRRVRSSRSKKSRYEDYTDDENGDIPPRSRKQSRKAVREEDYDESDEDIRPVKKTSSAQRSASSASASPARAAAVKRSPSAQTASSRRNTEASSQEDVVSSRKNNASRSKSVQNQDAMFEEMFAPKQTSQAVSQKTTSRQTPSPAVSRKSASNTRTAEEDPFAEWEKANARVTTSGRNAYRQVAETIDKAKGVSSDSQDAFSEFLAASTPVTAKKAEPKPAAANPVRQEVKAPAKSASDASDFDLDSILNEFK